MTEEKNLIQSTLKPKDSIKPGEYLESKMIGRNKCYRLILQQDGNVVLYLVYGRNEKNEVLQTVCWASNTEGVLARELKMQTDGNLVLYSEGGLAKWASHTQGNDGAELTLEDDGDLVIKYPTGRPVWKRP